MLFAVDTSTAQLGMALYDGTQLVAESIWISRARHTVELAPAMVEMFHRTGVEIDDLKVLGVAIGPGSFTSLRVGLAFVKGLVLARNIPLIGIPTFDVVAASQPQTDLPLGCILRAGRGRLALSWYGVIATGWKAQNGPTITTADELARSIKQDSILCGELSFPERQVLRKNKHAVLTAPAQSMRRPGLLAELAWDRWQAGQSDDAAALAPIYLHSTEPVPS